MTSLPPEKVAELRQLVHSHVSKAGVQDQIRSCLSGVVSEDDRSTLDEAALLEALERRGIVDQIMNTLDLSGLSEGSGVTEQRVSVSNVTTPRPAKMEVEECGNVESSPQTKSSRRPKPSSLRKRCLFLQVTGGRAFIEHLSDSTCTECHSTFTLHVHFRNQRFHSKPVPCSCDPSFDEGFVLELSKQTPHPDESQALSYTDALSLSDPVHLVLTRTNPSGNTETVGTCRLEWRSVLTERSGKMLASIELSGVGSEASIPAGILDLKLEILPCSREDLVHVDVLSAQLGMEKQRRDERERLFLVYTKQWWREYLEIRSTHSQRLVKIFAPDETGVNRPVCSYVRPLRAGRLLDSPRHAARFVSLFPFEKTSSVGNGGPCGDVWTSLHTLLSQKKGGCEDHCVLLCSLLLGFGLDAFICVGSKVKGVAHTWVMTLGHDGAVTFWESITGQRYPHPTFDPSTQAGTPHPPPTHPYRTIGCLFNHKCFYGNTQLSDSLLTCSFQLDDGVCWKQMSTEAIRSVTGHSVCSPSLLPSRVDAGLASSELETQLRALTEHHRQELGLSTVWDNDLCYLLTPALSSYETERCLGVGGVGNEEFQDAIRNIVPDGHSFKGFPIQLLHRDPRRAFTTCLRSPVGAEVVGCRGDRVRLAVRVRVFPYPEGVCAVWIMFAVKYQSIV